MFKFVPSIKYSSVLRKFAILFLLVSIIPLSLLTYIYFQLKQHSALLSYIPNLQPVLVLTIIGIGVGYIAMRRIINEFIKVGESNRNSIMEILGPLSLTNPNKETDEIETLTQTFYEVKQRLEKDIQELKLTKKTLHSVLGKVSQVIASAQDVDSLLRLIIETATDTFLGKTGLILLIDKTNSELYIKSMVGMAENDLKDRRFKINEGIWAKMVNATSPFVISKNELGAQYADFLESPLLCSPLLIRGTAHGVLVISGRRIPEDYQEEDQTLIYAVALQAAAMLSNLELKNLANIDPLTGTFNYRHLIERLDYEIARLRRYKGMMCLLMIDIDDFKTYNDTFGHVEGDILLQTTAATMRKQLRATDILCRYAGDEFVVILPGIEKMGAKVVAEKLRAAIEKLDLKQKVTVSVGCAKWVTDLSRQEIIVKADRALYKAKNNNKNNVALSDEDEV